nr:uncharacterized protein I303_05072 [Kwoniella dejecticola CBS 10117]OBR84215.1 hypothetical protein I303_05072 [Kwoniella dejecticola CBS 10117]
MFFSGIFCLVAGSYYTWRCYQMTKKNRFLLAGLILALLTQMIVTIVATSYGFATPTFDAEFLANFPEYMERGHYLYKIWGGITLTVNLALSIALAFLIFWTRYGIYHYDHRRYHKYTSVAYETMLPPTLCVFILVSLGNLSGSPFTDMRRVFTVILPLLSWNSFIQTLVGRMQIRHMRDSRRRDETTNILLNDAQKNVMPMGGLNDFAGQGQGQAQGFSFKSKRGGPRVFVSPPRKL